MGFKLLKKLEIKRSSLFLKGLKRCGGAGFRGDAEGFRELLSKNIQNTFFDLLLNFFFFGIKFFFQLFLERFFLPFLFLDQGFYSEVFFSVNGVSFHDNFLVDNLSEFISRAFSIIILK